jgi:hypothetical protein
MVTLVSIILCGWLSIIIFVDKGFIFTKTFKFLIKHFGYLSKDIYRFKNMEDVVLFIKENLTTKELKKFLNKHPEYLEFI